MAHDLHAAVHQRLLTTGEYDRIQTLLRTRLSDSGWSDALRARAQDIAKSMAPLSGRRILDAVHDDPQTNPVPDPIKREVILALRQFIDKQFE